MFTVGLAQPEDYERLCQCDQLMSSGSVLVRLERRKEIAHALINRYCYIAKQEGFAVGYAIFGRFFFKKPFISLLIVHPAHRRRGVATHLIHYIETLCHAEKLFTSTNQSNINTQELFKKLGFLACGYIDQLDYGDSELFYYKLLL